MRRLPILVGPTASGKTAVALTLARRLGAEIVSADSRQVYRYLSIGTAKPTPAELASVRHHFVDELDPTQPFSAGEFGRQGRALIGTLFERGILPLVVGGSGLYIQALVDGLFAGPAADLELRRSLQERLKREGRQALHTELERVDPAALAGMRSPTDRRIIRALEVYAMTGRPLSELQRTELPSLFMPVFAGLEWERKVLYQRIDERVDRMLAEGLIEEVGGLLAHGLRSGMNVLQTVGYQETCRYLVGEFDRAELRRLVQRNTRRYAKRQLTWFRRDPRIRWFRLQGERGIEDAVEQIHDYFTEALGRASLPCPSARQV